jgi:hypothetical protein
VNAAIRELEEVRRKRDFELASVEACCLIEIRLS